MEVAIFVAIIVLAVLIGVGGFFMYGAFGGSHKINDILGLIQSGRVREAKSSLTKILDKDDRNIRARYLLALCFQKESDYNSAIIELRQCLKIARWSAELEEGQVRRKLAESLSEVGNKTDAKNEYLILTTLEPDNYEPFFQAGKLFQSSGVWAKAVQFLSKAIQLNPKHAESLSLLGQAHYQMGSMHDAKDALSKATSIHKDNRVAHYFLGLALRSLGDFDWAIKELEESERDDKLKEKSILARCMIYIDQQNFIKAIADLTRGLKVAPPSGEIAINMRYLLALAGEKTRDLQLAIENWEKIESIKPGFRDVREKLKQYSDFRTDDTIKDFLIASVSQFEGVCRKIATGFKLQVLNLNIVNDSKIVITANQDESTRRNARLQHTLILVQREMNPVTEQQVRDFQESMRQNNAGKGLFLTTGDITPGAVNYASSRPIELYDSTRIIDLVRSAMK